MSRYIRRSLLWLFALTLITACQDEPFIVPDEDAVEKNGEVVDVLIPYVVPMNETEVVTRALSEDEEHNVLDLFVFVFDANGKKVFGKYFAMEELLGKNSYSEAEGEYSLDDNSSRGYVMAQAVTGTCFIYGIANVLQGEVKAVTENRKTGLTDLRAKLDTVSNIASLHNVQVDLDEASRTAAGSSTPSLLERYSPNLLMSGAWRSDSDVKDTDGKVNTQLTEFRQKIAGKVKIPEKDDSEWTVTTSDGKTKQVINLSKLGGRIYLRRLTSHVTFQIEINHDVIEDFKPESWQVVHLPVRSFLIDQGNQTEETHSNVAFTISEVRPYMTHQEDMFVFDFYTLENHKGTRDVDGPRFKQSLRAVLGDTDHARIYNLTYPLTVGGVEYANADAYATAIENYYKQYWGNGFNDTGTAADNKLKDVYEKIYGTGTEEAKNAFLYAKRDLEVKMLDGLPLKNDKGSKNFWASSGLDGSTGWDETEYKYTSNKYVYVEPKATYVVIKGRIRLKQDAAGQVTMRNTMDNTESKYASGYADVQYVVHLGNYAYNYLDEDGNVQTQPALSNFTTLRNTEYTYKVKINGVNNIYTEVITDFIVDGDGNATENLNRHEPQPGASGKIGLASSKIYNTDAHFNSFNIHLDQQHIEKFLFEIHTPFSDIVFPGLDYTDKDDTGDHNKALKKKYTDEWSKNSDFTWIKFRRCYDQTPGNIDEGYYRHTMLYKGGAYDADYPLMDLYQLAEELRAIANKDKTDVTLTVDADGKPTSKGAWDGRDLYYTVFLDENFYKKPPTGQSWTHPYWHHFVNQPARYVVINDAYYTETATEKAGYSDGFKYSADMESGVIESKLMIVQPSIQTYYNNISSSVQNALGVEHYNETQAPRWIDFYYNTDQPDMNTDQYDHDDGWKNTAKWMVGTAGDEKRQWTRYVDDKVNRESNNLAMIPWKTHRHWKHSDSQSTNETYGTIDVVSDNEQGQVTDNPYLANAIRLCMNRNRDENGNGVIDENELKWYLPASHQLLDISMHHYSLYDPLFNYNDFYAISSNSYLSMPEEKYEDGRIVGVNDRLKGGFMEAYHFVASDYRTVKSEEMVTVSNYDEGGGFWTVRAKEMRCVRNLNISEDDTGDSYVSKSPYANPIDMRTYSYDANTRTFTMAELDSRSIRPNIVLNMELKEHYLFSPTNRTYQAFQVAKNLTYLKASDYPNGKVRISDIYAPVGGGSSLCQKYSEEPNQGDIGTWRTPNAMELAIMVNYHRDIPSSEEFIPRRSFSMTSWNFFPIWGRVTGVRDGNNRLYLSDPYSDPALQGYDTNDISQAERYTWDPSKVGKSYEQGFGLDRDLSVRCVRDVKP